MVKNSYKILIAKIAVLELLACQEAFSDSGAGSLLVDQAEGPVLKSVRVEVTIKRHLVQTDDEGRDIRIDIDRIIGTVGTGLDAVCRAVRPKLVRIDETGEDLLPAGSLIKEADPGIEAFLIGFTAHDGFVQIRDILIVALLRVCVLGAEEETISCLGACHITVLEQISPSGDLVVSALSAKASLIQVSDELTDRILFNHSIYGCSVVLADSVLKRPVAEPLIEHGHLCLDAVVVAKSCLTELEQGLSGSILPHVGGISAIDYFVIEPGSIGKTVPAKQV